MKNVNSIIVTIDSLDSTFVEEIGDSADTELGKLIKRSIAPQARETVNNDVALFEIAPKFECIEQLQGLIGDIEDAWPDPEEAEEARLEENKIKVKNGIKNLANKFKKNHENLPK